LKRFSFHLQKEKVIMPIIAAEDHFRGEKIMQPLTMGSFV